MKGFDEFKKKVLEDKSFAEKFKDVKSREELINSAKKNGYNFTKTELQNKDANDEVLEAVSGGADITIKNETNYGDGCIEFVGTLEDAKAIAAMIKENKKR